MVRRVFLGGSVPLEDRRKSRRAASGGALALESPRATRSQPEFIRTVLSQNFGHIFEFSRTCVSQPLQASVHAQPNFLLKNGVFTENLYGLWLSASGARRLKPLRLPRVQNCGHVRDMVDFWNRLA